MVVDKEATLSTGSLMAAIERCHFCSDNLPNLWRYQEEKCHDCRRTEKDESQSFNRRNDCHLFCQAWLCYNRVNSHQRDVI